MRTTLRFLEKVTLTPSLVGPDDVAPMRAAGVTDEAIEEALYVAVLFNVMDRLADAFDFELTRKENLPRLGQILLKLGYKVAAVPG